MCVAFTWSEPGGHAANEDAFVVEQHPRDPSCWIGALADGQGGRSGGGEAARLACRAVIETAATRPVDALRRNATWLDMLRAADQRVHADDRAGYTTLIGLAVAGDRIVGASNGDSELWLMGGDGRVSELTDRQEKNPPIGSGYAAIAPFAAPLVRSWLVLAMSDGVWKYVGYDAIREALETFRGQGLIDALLSRARLPRTGGLPDDFTAVVLQTNDGPAADHEPRSSTAPSPRT
jgi:serine/threonine protein phosphatase PrpC